MQSWPSPMPFFSYRRIWRSGALLASACLGYVAFCCQFFRADGSGHLEQLHGSKFGVCF